MRNVVLGMVMVVSSACGSMQGRALASTKTKKPESKSFQALLNHYQMKTLEVLKND